jgi:peroxiredoxin
MMRVTRFSSFPVFILLTSALHIGLMQAAESTTRTTITEARMKERMALSGYKVVEYRDAKGNAITFDEFMKQLATSGGYSKDADGKGERAVLKVISAEEANKPPPKPALSIQPGSPLPPSAFTDSEGRRTSIDKFSGKPLLLSFYFAECAPCIQEVGMLNHYAASHPDVGVLALTTDDDSVAREFVQQRGFKWPVASATAYIKQLGIHSYPTLMLVSSQGRLLAVRTGGSVDTDQASEKTALNHLEHWVDENLKGANRKVQ